MQQKFCFFFQYGDQMCCSCSGMDLLPTADQHNLKQPPPFLFLNRGGWGDYFSQIKLLLFFSYHLRHNFASFQTGDHSSKVSSEKRRSLSLFFSLTVDNLWLQGWEYDNLIASLSPPKALFSLLYPASRAVCHTCLPSCSSDGRGWDRSPNLCFDSPGKVERKGTKETRSLGEHPRTLCASSPHWRIVPPQDKSVRPERNLTAVRSLLEGMKNNNAAGRSFSLFSFLSKTYVYWMYGYFSCFWPCFHLCVNGCALGVWWWAVMLVLESGITFTSV